MASNVRPVTTAQRSPARSRRRAGLVLLAVLLVVASVAAQAIEETPVAVVLLVLAGVSFAPLALPPLES